MPHAVRPALRALLAATACAAAFAASPLLAGDETAIRLKPGQSRSFTFPENPSTGYAWAIDEGASRGLDVVAVADGGHRGGGTMPGAPGERDWTVRGLAPGHAEIVFAYRRAWEPAAVQTQRVLVDVAQ